MKIAISVAPTKAMVAYSELPPKMEGMRLTMTSRITPPPTAVTTPRGARLRRNSAGSKAESHGSPADAAFRPTELSPTAISLIVGGIGIMNIMLVSVTERTREIGLRLAIGALEREVLLQFLIEAVVLAALGGLIGIAIAAVASVTLAQLMQVPFVFNPTVNLLSFVFSAAIGVVFGYFPARRAAQLDPIEALRHE